MQQIREARAELASVQRQNHHPNRAPEGSLQRWTPPPPGSVCINGDAAMSPSTGNRGLGVIARSCEGVICGGRAVQREASSTEELKALAVMEGVKVAITRGWQDVLIESDAELVIKHLNGAIFCGDWIR